MASGFGARGSEGRCAPLWREFTKVRRADEDARADRAARAYQSAFGELLAAPVRYQGNRVFVAGAGVVEADAVAAAERLGWPFDPRSRLRRLERVS